MQLQRLSRASPHLMMLPDDTKGDISRLNLQSHGINYEENVFEVPNESHPLPDHVDAVREALLSFGKIVPREWELDLLEESIEYGKADIGPAWTHLPDSSAFIDGRHYERDLRERGLDWTIAHENFKSFAEVAESARELLEDPEAEWNHFWRSDLFTRFSKEARKQPGYSPTLDAWSLHESVTWNEFENLMKPRYPLESRCPLITRYALKSRTQPKPDLTYAFPIQNLPYGSLKGFARDEFSQSLSLQVLRELVQQGVSCAPTTGLSKWTAEPEKTNLSSSNKTCFPWAVVEMKRHARTSDASIDRCYCQAANAAAAALELQAQLLEKLGSDALAQPPPVIAFTCIGPIVKVWLAYQDTPGLLGTPKQRMICIWSTSVQLTWGVASIRAIIMNMHTWASRLLKPKIQAYIHQAVGRVRQTTPGNSQASPSQTPLACNFGSPQNNTPRSLPLPLNGSDSGSLSSTPRISTPTSPQNQKSPVSLLDGPRLDTPNDSRRTFIDPSRFNPSNTTQLASGHEVASPYFRRPWTDVSNGSRLSAGPSSPTAIFGRRQIKPTGDSQISSGETTPVPLFTNPQINSSNFIGFTGANTSSSRAQSHDSSFHESISDSFSAAKRPPDQPIQSSKAVHSCLTTSTTGCTPGGFGTHTNQSFDGFGTATSKTSARPAVKCMHDPKNNSRISEPGEQSATPRKTDYTQVNVDNLTKAFGSSSLGDPCHFGQRHGAVPFESGNDSDNWARKTAISGLMSRPLSGERRIDLQTLGRIISGFENWQQEEICSRAETERFRNPNGTYSVPLYWVIRCLNIYLEPEDQIRAEDCVPKSKDEFYERLLGY